MGYGRGRRGGGGRRRRRQQQPHASPPRQRRRRRRQPSPVASTVEEWEEEDEGGRLPDRWPTDKEEEGEIDAALLDRYFTVDSWERTGSESRHTLSEQCVVRFQDFENAARPQNLLAMCIDRLLQRVLEGRAEPARIGFQLQCPNFERPFYVPLRPPHQNTAQVIADALQQVCEQSGDGTDIFTDPCQTKVLAVWDSKAGKTQKGEGACSAQEHGLGRPMECRSMVRVVNPGDAWCMARAILLGLMDRQCRLQRWSRQRFQQMCEQQHLHGEMARQLLLRAGCRTNKPHYGVADLARLQHLLDGEIGPRQVRLVVFDQLAAFQVLWKGPQCARFNLCLVFSGRHYNYVARPEQLIKARAYCVDCESRVTYRTHPDGCRAVCRLCYRFGMKQPCRPDGTPRRRCAQCGFHFANAGCFSAHQRVMDPAPPGFGEDRRRAARPRQALCQQRWVCQAQHCGAIVWARSRRPHRCGTAAAIAQSANRPRRRRQWRQQQQQAAAAAAAAHEPHQEPWCAHCHGPHALKMPCFIQPRAYEDKCQTENIYEAAAAAAEEAAANEDDGPPPELVAEPSNGTSDGRRRGRRRRLPSTAGGDDQEEEFPPQLEQMPLPHEQQPQPAAAAAEPVCRKPIRFLWWNVETWLDTADDANDRKHIPVLICAEVLCERCIRAGLHIVEHPHRRAPDCLCGGLWQSGGQNRARWCMPIEEPQLAALTTDGRNPRRLQFHNFGGAEQPPMVQFADFLLHHGPMEVTTIALSHNGGRYDMHLLMEELQRRGQRPKRLLSTGLKYYVLELGGRHRRHVLSKDTLHFFSCPLAALPRTFGLDESQCSAKPYFPYGWMRAENLHVELDGLPPIECYEPERMKPAERAALLRWYTAEQQRQPRPRFLLTRELVVYCANDVAILRESVLHFRHMIGEISHRLEPFLAASSVAGLALAIFLKCFLPYNRLAHTPEGGLLRGRRASMASRRFFALLEALWPNARIRHAQWSIGEEQPDDSGLRIDGVWRRPAPLRPLALEFLGCYYHGCPDCYPQREQRLAGGQTAATLWAKTEARRTELERRHGYSVRHIRECHFNWVLKHNSQLRAMYRRVDVVEPLDLRKHAYFGGRVEPFHFYHRCSSPDEEIILLDIVSLYPWAMKYGEFPVGNPRVWTREELRPRHSASLPWRRPDQLPYRGFIQCRVLAPRRMPNEQPPLLPYRTSDHRLTFPLCGACAERCQQRPCRHTPRQRSWVAAYGHEELKKALSLGYRVLGLFEVWEYERWASLADGDGGLFGGYVNAFLKLKAESSGWPAECKTAAEREAYLQEFEAREGIRLDPAKLDHPNPVLRHIAKLMLNSLYGKFGQRADRTSIQYTNTTGQFHQLVLEDNTLDVLDFLHINERMDRVVTRKRTPFVEAAETNCLAVACIVTELARLRHYSFLEEAVRQAHKLLYGDTDSCMYVHRAGTPFVREGEWLGDMKREMGDRRIVEAVFAGPKNYGYRHVAADDQTWWQPGHEEDGVAPLRIRGLKLTYAATQMVNFAAMRRLVLDHFDVFGERARGEREGVPREVAIHIPNVQFHRNKWSEVRTRHGLKRYLPVYSKGIVCAGGVARPFGWLPSATAQAAPSAPPQIAPTLLGNRGEEEEEGMDTE